MKHAKFTVRTKKKVVTSRLNSDWLKIKSLLALKVFGHTAHDWTNQMPETVNCQSGDNSWLRPPASTIRCDDFQIKGRSFTRFNETEGSFLAPEVIIKVQWTNMWHGKCLDLRINKFLCPCQNYMLQRFCVGLGIVNVPM